MRDTLIQYMRAGYPGLYLVSFEEKRVRDSIRDACAQLKRRLLVWSCTTGLVEFPDEGPPVIHKDKDEREITDPIPMLDTLLKDQPEKTVMVALDFHLFLADSNPVVLRKLKDTLFALKQQAKTLIVVGARLLLPVELEKELLVLDFPLPDKAQLKQVLDATLVSAKRQPLAPAIETEVLRAAGGLTTDEAENAYALSIIRHGQVEPTVVAHEKAMTVRKNGLLRIEQPPGSLDEVGGLDHLKEWLRQRRDNFSDEAIEYGIEVPKGALFFGPPGTGKSLVAKVTASVFGNVPLLRCDVGNIFGSLVGESERNMRSVIATAEAIAPCVLFFDEIDKGLSGTGSSGRTDGGTGARVFATLLQWMNDKTAPVFVVATANHPTMLDAALLRKGRWDEIWFVDLPSPAERAAIWRIHLSKKSRKLETASYDIDRLVARSDGFTGAEIETVLKDAMTVAFSQRRRATTDDIVLALSQTMPVATLMREDIRTMREWAAGRARLASPAAASTKPAPNPAHGYGRPLDEAPPSAVVIVATPPPDVRPGQN